MFSYINFLFQAIFIRELWWAQIGFWSIEARGWAISKIIWTIGAAFGIGRIHGEC